MTHEELVRCTAWPPVICFVGAWATRILKDGPQFRRISFWMGLTGWILLAIHIGLAFVIFHHGSWAAVVEHTSQRTWEFSGWRSGAGAWLNLLTLGIWAIDLQLQVTAPAVPTPAGTRSGPGITRIALPNREVVRIFFTGYLALMFFFATAGFGSYPARILGWVSVILLFLCVKVRLSNR